MRKSIRWRIAQFFEARWWNKYLAHKDVESYLNWKKNYWQKVIEKINGTLKMQTGQTILDAGCGPAGIFINLPSNKVTAFDPLLDTYERILPHFKKKMYPSVDFHTADLESFKSEELFDVVFCMNAINHVSQLDEAFLTVYNCTKKGGKMVVSIDAHNHGIFKYLFRSLPADILHPHQYDLEEYKRMLTSLGCTILQTELMEKGFLFNYYILVAVKN